MKVHKPNLPDSAISKEDAINLPGYPLYPPSEDIYNNAKEEEEIDPENISKTKSLNDNDPGDLNEKDFSDDVSESDLNSSFSELNDDQERIDKNDDEPNRHSKLERNDEAYDD